MADLASVEIVAELPPAGHYTERGYRAFERLPGAKIVACGAPADPDLVEGGGFVIDYIPAGAETVHRLVFAFTELGMWIEFDGIKGSS
jgi:hypothetical protein